MLSPPPPPPPPPRARSGVAASLAPLARQPLLAGVLLLCCFPVGLYLFWIGPYSQRVKVAVSVATGLLVGLTTLGAILGPPGALPAAHLREGKVLEAAQSTTSDVPTSTTTSRPPTTTTRATTTTRRPTTTTTRPASTTTSAPTTTTLPPATTTPAPAPIWDGALAARCPEGWRATFSVNTEDELARVVWYNDEELGGPTNPPDVLLSVQVLAPDGEAVFLMNITGRPAPATVRLITDNGTKTFTTTFVNVPTSRALVELPFGDLDHLDRLRGTPTVTAQVDASGCDAFSAQ